MTFKQGDRAVRFLPFIDVPSVSFLPYLSRPGILFGLAPINPPARTQGTQGTLTLLPSDLCFVFRWFCFTYQHSFIGIHICSFIRNIRILLRVCARYISHLSASKHTSYSCTRSEGPPSDPSRFRLGIGRSFLCMHATTSDTHVRAREYLRFENIYHVC